MQVMRGILSPAVILLGVLAITDTAHSTETITYSYDAQGRLVAVSKAGGPADGKRSDYEYDSAGNRTRAKVSSAGGAPACALQAYDSTTGDEYTASANVVVVGQCPVNITLSYTLTYVSGSGPYYDGGFIGGNVLPAGQTTKSVRVYSQSCSVQDLVVRVNWSADNATVTPTYSTINFFNSC